MRLRFALLMVCVMLTASSVRADFQAYLVNVDFPIQDACTGGTPIPDGTIVQIFQDFTANGPDATDVRPTEGTENVQVNYNQFLTNGVSEFGIPGTFAPLETFAMNSGFPTPADGSGHPVYYLRICLDAQNTIWMSDTFRVSQGYQEIFFGPGLGQIPFTCTNGECGGCPTPATVSNATATTTFCDSVVIDWDHNGVDAAGYRITLLNTFPLEYIFVPGAANTRYSLTNQIGGMDIPLRIRAYNVCDDDTSLSSGIDVVGRTIVGPPTPVGLAADDSCQRVTLSWTITTISGLDSEIVRRDGVALDTLPRGTAGTHFYVDNFPPAGIHEYCVLGWSATCGNGDEVCINAEAEGTPACTITNVVASDDDCDEVCITWTATCTDVTEFRILRDNNFVASVPVAGPNYSFCHAAPAGTVGQYQIQPRNACGNGTAQPATPEPGSRLAPPGNVLTIVASDNLCNGVCVTWADLPAADQYQVRRNTDIIATVAGDVNTYCDLTAIAGVTYTFTIVGTNECGIGSVAPGNTGTRAVPGNGTATFTLVTAGPPNWTYSMDVLTGCLDRVKIEDYCEGTTATAPNGWTVAIHGLDSIVFSTTTAVGADDPVVTGFGLAHSTCDGNGGWTIGQSGGSIRGPLPVGANAEIPTEFGVNVYPNPFNPMTNFKIAIPQASDTRILVFNVTGQLVRDMNLGKMQAGYHTVQFGGSDLPSGMYFAKVLSGNFHSTHKLMLLK